MEGAYIALTFTAEGAPYARSAAIVALRHWRRLALECKEQQCANLSVSGGDTMNKILIAVLALLWSVSSGAQQRPSLAIVIETLDQDAVSCGVYKSSLESIAALTLRNNGIQVAESLSNPYLYIQPIVLMAESGGIMTGCAVGLNVEVNISVLAPKARFKPKGDKWVSTAVCEKSGLFLGPTSSIVKQVNDQLEKLIKLCLGELDY